MTPDDKSEPASVAALLKPTQSRGWTLRPTCVIEPFHPNIPHLQISRLV